MDAQIYTGLLGYIISAVVAASATIVAAFIMAHATTAAARQQSVLNCDCSTMMLTFTKKSLAVHHSQRLYCQGLVSGTLTQHTAINME